MTGDDNGVFSTLERAVKTLADAPAAASSLVGGTNDLLNRLKTAHQHATDIAQFGLLPVGLALLVLHEQYRAVTEGTSFRVAHVLGRAAAIVALLLAYGKVCTLITVAAGGGGTWMTNDSLLSSFSSLGAAVNAAFGKVSGFSDWPRFALVILISFVLICATLFAYAAGLFLSLSQSALTAVLLIVGKPCIAASVVPGVGVGKSWAKALAQVAAWSTVAGIITALLGARRADVKALIEAGDLVPMLKASAEFIVFAIATLSVPKIVAMIFSGAVTAAGSGIGSSLLAGYAAAKALASGRGDHGTRRGPGPSNIQRPDGQAVASGATTAENSRVHKTAYEGRPPRESRPLRTARAPLRPERMSVRSEVKPAEEARPSPGRKAPNPEPGTGQNSRDIPVTTINTEEQ